MAFVLLLSLARTILACFDGWPLYNLLNWLPILMMMHDPRTSYYRSRRAFDILIVIVGIFINRVLKAPGSHYRYTYIFRIANTLFCVEDDD